MKLKYCYQSLLCALAFNLAMSPVLSPAMAEQYGHRQHDSHEHGSARLSIAAEAGELLLEFNSPAMNLVGFEHKAVNKKQRKAVQQAIKLLESASKIFSLPEAAQCQLNQAQVNTSLLDHKHDHKHDNKHEHRDSIDDNHTATHADFIVEYHYQCQQMSALDRITVNLFQHFPATHTLDVEMITDKGQQAVELNMHQNVINFQAGR